LISLGEAELLAWYTLLNPGRPATNCSEISCNNTGWLETSGGEMFGLPVADVNHLKHFNIWSFFDNVGIIMS